MAKVQKRTYRLDDLDDTQWEEIESLGFEEFEPNSEKDMTRRQWMAVAHMCLGKAQRIESGDYGDTEENDPADNLRWANELREIAEVILTEFRPGDGKV